MTDNDKIKVCIDLDVAMYRNLRSIANTYGFHFDTLFMLVIGLGCNDPEELIRAALALQAATTTSD